MNRTPPRTDRVWSARRVERLLGSLLLLLSAAAFPAPARADRIVPASARAAGRNGAFFQTDLRLLNASFTDSAAATLVFHPASGAASVSVEVSLPPRRQAAYDDVLGSLFGAPEGSSGPIRVVAPENVEVSTRTYNVVDPCSNGTYGTWVPGLSPAAALRSGAVPQVASSASPASGSRTNLVVVNPSAAVARVTISLHAGDGRLLGTAALPPVPTNGSFQGDLFDLAGAAGTTETNAFLSFSSDQPVFVLATLIDNRTNDSAALLALPAPPPPATLVQVGDRATFAGAYGVSGKAEVVSGGLVRLTDFRASGTAPGLDVRVGKHADPRRSFTVLRVLGRQSFSGATLDLALPPGVDLDAFDTVNVWCYEFDVTIAEGRFARP